jgi:ubiquitin carboxyl-terminal hydrolase 48
VRKGKKKATNIIELSDDDDPIEESVESSETSLPPGTQQRYISSKDAYMLIYARRDLVASSHAESMVATEAGSGVSEPPALPSPPPEAVDEVIRLNEEHDRQCQEYQKRRVPRACRSSPLLIHLFLESNLLWNYSPRSGP